MSTETNKSLNKLACAGILVLLFTRGSTRASTQPIFENIPVTTAPGHQGPAAIWGNYIVWKGAHNEAYDIAQRRIVEMPGLYIDGAPAIWDNKVVWGGASGYYDLDAQQMVHPAGLSVGDYPAMHNGRIVWSDSTGYYDLNLGEMISAAGLSIGHKPDIFADKMVWYESDGYYDISLAQMVYPEGLHVSFGPAIYDRKITWSYLTGDYYDIELEEYVHLEGAYTFFAPDVFEDTFVWQNYDAVPPISVDIFIWDPIGKQRRVTQSGTAGGAKIYNNIVVWVDTRNGDADIYMAVIPEPSSVALLGVGLVACLSGRKRQSTIKG